MYCAYNDHNMQIGQADHVFYCNIFCWMSYSKRLLFWKIMTSCKNVSIVFDPWVSMFKTEHVYYNMHVCNARYMRAFLPSNTTHEPACFPSVLKRDLRISNTHSQLYWWLARYDRPVSAWVLATLKTTRIKPVLTPSYANFPHRPSGGQQRQRHVPQYMK